MKAPSTRAARAGLTFRRITDADLPFLARVYASTRTEELAATPWTEAQKAAFLDMQFRAQHADYQTNYPEADWLVTLRGGENIGRLYIERWPSQHCIIEIAFLPEHRGKGLGEALLRDLHQRIRDVRQGPDGNLYVLTEENDSALLKIEPVAPAATTPSAR